MPPEWIAAIGWFMAFANAAATVYWVRLARDERRRRGNAVALHNQASVELANTRDELRLADGELERLKRQQLERDKRDQLVNVAALVPALGRRASATEDSAGFCRKALRAQIAWFNDCPAILPFRDLLCSAQLDGEMRHTMACEVYARSILESALAWHLDGTNPRTDRAVLRQLRDSLGDEFAQRVHLDVEARGLVFVDALTPAPAEA